jgi:hypothetical protein
MPTRRTWLSRRIVSGEKAPRRPREVVGLERFPAIAKYVPVNRLVRINSNDGRDRRLPLGGNSAGVSSLRPPRRCLTPRHTNFLYPPDFFAQVPKATVLRGTHGAK